MTRTNRGARGRPNREGTDSGRARATPVTRAERDAFGAATRYARVHDLATPPERAYLEALPAARREITHRFVRGVLRGNPAGIPEPRFVSFESLESAESPDPAEPDPPPPSPPDEPELLSALPERRWSALVSRLPDDCRRLALVAVPAAETALFVPIAATHGYDRFRLTGPVYRWSRGESDGAPETDADADAAPDRLSHPVDLVPLLECEGAFSDAEQAERIRAEVAESVANLALARLAAAAHAATVDASADEGPLEAVATGLPAADAGAAFERIVTDGHPFHPGGKIRRGMTPGEGLAYAPEFADRIALRYVAVDREYALETRAREPDASLTERLYAAFDGLEGALERAVPAGRDPNEYAVVPIHPLQFHGTIPNRYAEQIADGRVVPLPEYVHPVTPQLNLRTVVPYGTERPSANADADDATAATAAGDEPLPHLKLAIDVQTTNVVRTLSPHAVTNGPRVTDIARTIAEREAFETLGLLDEPAATCYYPPGGPHPSGEGFDDARHLSGLVRTNPVAHPLVSEDATPVVASSLVAEAPTTGRPLVREVIERYGAATDAGTADDAALAFLDRYAAVVVPDQLRLLCTYGIALESHLQNSLVVFDSDARPTATLVRDLGGIRVHRDRLAERGLSIDPYPDSDVDADGEGDLHRKLYYALFQNHLAELVATIGDEFAVDERECWELIREHCEDAFERVRTDSRVPDARVERDERALFDDPATHKALTAMRLRGKRHEYVTSAVSNPLAR